VEGLLAAARAKFRLERVAGLEALRAAWSGPHPDEIRLGVAAAPGELYLLSAARESGRLDVSFLHESILRELMGIGEDQVRKEQRIRYIRGLEAALAEVRGGRTRLAFLLEPAAIADVSRVAFSGGVMPQKSTDFYPKLLSGLTAYRLER